MTRAADRQGRERGAFCRWLRALSAAGMIEPCARCGLAFRSGGAGGKPAR